MKQEEASIKQRIKSLFVRIDILLRQLANSDGFDTHLKCLQILVPSTKDFNEIAIYTAYADAIDLKNYQKFAESFVQYNPKTKEVERTLYFLDNTEPFYCFETGKQKKVKSPKLYNYNAIQVDQELYVISDSDRKAHSADYHPDLISNYWSDWQRLFKQHYKSDTTLWISRTIKVNLEFVSHAFLTIDGKVPLKNSYNYYVVMQIVKYISEIFTNHAAVIHSLEISRQATRAAISQVMARNMSHNIGSHVLSKLISKDAINSILSGSASNQYTPFQGLNARQTTSINKLAEENAKEEIAWFNSYLRNRMDYLADIATGVPAMEVTRQLVGDIISGLDRNIILLNRISGVDCFRFSFEIRDCRKCNDDCRNEQCKLDGIAKDIPVSIPNDVMGFHSLYVVIENIIRNTAKHGGSNIPKKLREKAEVKFTIEVRDCAVDNTLYELVIYEKLFYIEDNIKKEFVIPDQDHKLTEEDKSSYSLHLGSSSYFEDLPKPVPGEYINYFDWLAVKQNIRLNKSVLDKSNKLRQGAWGLVEMDVSAAYLRKLAPEDVDLDRYELDIYHEKKRQNNCCFTANDGKKFINILKAINKNNSLGYRFHIMKPKEMIIVDESGELLKSITENDRIKLREYGIEIINSIDKTKIFPHPFLMIIAGEEFNLDYYLYKEIKEEETTIKVFNSNLPTRIIVCKEEAYDERGIAYFSPEHEIIKTLKGSPVKVLRNNPFEDNTIIDLAWKIWLENKFRHFKITSTNYPYSSSYVNDDFKNAYNQFTIKLDDHGQSLPEICKFDYYEIFKFQSVNIAMNKLLDWKNDKANDEFDKQELFKFLDGIFSKVLVLDERVQDAAQKEYSTTYGTSAQISKLLKKVNVIVPKVELLNLNNPRFDDTYTSRIWKAVRIASAWNIKIPGLDFIVIHLGIIEKTLEASIPRKEKDKKEVRSFVMNLQSKYTEEYGKNVRIIITSGRGKPDNLPEEIPFIAYSILSQYCIEARFKSFLNQAVQSARPLN